MATHPAQPELIVIVGPTASGKSELAMRVACRFNGEIIAADSTTIYKGMDIATAKPTNDERSLVPHHMLDVLEPTRHFTVAEFKEMANQAIGKIQARGRLPIIVGGSGLYIDSIIFNFKFGSVNKKLRSELEEMSVDELIRYAEENNISPGGIQLKNKRHLVRAIERGGAVKQRLKLRPGCLVVGINPPKDILDARISRRVAKMIEDGFVEEAHNFRIRFGWENQQASIYEVVRDYELGNKIEQDIATDLEKKHRNLAKRQRTWFKRNPYIEWFKDKEAAEAYLNSVLNT